MNYNCKTLPNFLIVGAAKSGTTSLYRYLDQHSEIFMPSFKEPHFFVSKMVKGKIKDLIDDFNTYQKLFENTENFKLRGEASVFYLYYFEEAIKNILKSLGKDTKIIIILRNPIDRAYSAYKQVTSGIPDLMIDFESALKKDYTKSSNITPMFHLKEMGLYFNSVKAYMDNFENVRVILFNEFIKNTKQELSHLFTFLQLQMDNINYNEKFNVGRSIWKSKFLGNLILRDNILKNFLKKIPIHNNYKKLLITLLTKKHKEFSYSTKEYLINYYNDDIKNLSSLIGVNLNHWLV